MYSGFYGTFIAHIFSLIAAFWSLLQVYKCQLPGIGQTLILLSQLLIIINSGLALIRYGTSDGYKLRKPHVITLNLSMICYFSFFHVALNLNAKLSTLCNILPVFNVISFFKNVSKLDYCSRNKPTDVIIALNSIVLLGTCIWLENYNAVAFILSFAFGYFYVGDCGYFLDTEVPSIDIYQYIQCFLCFFTANAICS